jgi:hypothetical protein
MAKKQKSVEDIIEDIRDQLDLLQDKLQELESNQCECNDLDNEDDYDSEEDSDEE